MTNRTRVTAFLSVSALCLGLAAAPAAFAADASSSTAKPTKSHMTKHKAKAKKPTAATPAK